MQSRARREKSMEFKGLGSQWIINWMFSWSVGSGEGVNCLRRQERRSGQIAAPTKSEFPLLPNYVSVIMSALKGIFKSVMDSQRVQEKDAAVQTNCALNQESKSTLLW